jgi:hypothetical protein
MTSDMKGILKSTAHSYCVEAEGVVSYRDKEKLGIYWFENFKKTYLPLDLCNRSFLDYLFPIVFQLCLAGVGLC